MPFKHEDSTVRATREWAHYRQVCEAIRESERARANPYAQPMTDKERAALDAVWNAVKATKEWAAAKGDG